MPVTATIQNRKNASAPRLRHGLARAPKPKSNTVSTRCCARCRVWRTDGAALGANRDAASAGAAMLSTEHEPAGRGVEVDHQHMAGWERDRPFGVVSERAVRRVRELGGN